MFRKMQRIEVALTTTSLAIFDTRRNNYVINTDLVISAGIESTGPAFGKLVSCIYKIVVLPIPGQWPEGLSLVVELSVPLVLVQVGVCSQWSPSSCQLCSCEYVPPSCIWWGRSWQSWAWYPALQPLFVVYVLFRLPREWGLLRCCRQRCSTSPLFGLTTNPCWH